MQAKLDAIRNKRKPDCWCNSDVDALHAILTVPGALTSLWSIIQDREDTVTQWRNHLELSEVGNEHDL